MWQKAKNQYHLVQSLIANVQYGFPGRKLVVIGVTGTSGKTTTALMIYSMLHAAGYRVSVLTTIKAIIAGKEYDTGFHVTTPDPHVLPKYLNEAVKHGDTHMVLEVSSHALDQNRTAFIPFEIGVLTSFAHEHLDYHKTLANYARAKFSLLHAAKVAILPVDVINDTLKHTVRYSNLLKKIKLFGLNKGDVTQEE
jgi:UDP-N-acetylmuramoyl-L-alanyl-D-glutamate--2,6-diaminopimelate ligase